MMMHKPDPLPSIKICPICGKPIDKCDHPQPNG